MKAYNDSKNFLNNYKELKKYRNNEKHGVENWFRSFLELSNENKK